jgi:hypothetical protein
MEEDGSSCIQAQRQLARPGRALASNEPVRERWIPNT